MTSKKRGNKRSVVGWLSWGWDGMEEGGRGIDMQVCLIDEQRRLC
jgi:hypothetical protein